MSHERRTPTATLAWSSESIARVVTVLCAGTLTVVGLAGSRTISSAALLSDVRSTAPATVATGTLALSVSGGAAAGSWTGAVSLTPGASAYAGVTVRNAGSVTLRYAVRASSTSPLAATLRATVVALPGGSPPCSAVAFTTGTRVSVLDGPFGASPAIDIIGDTSTGAQAGDRDLEAEAAEQLCLRVTFPLHSGAGAAARGTSATTTFTVMAENA